MQIKFGYTFDDRRKLEKSVTWFNTFDCKPYTDYNISAPNLLITNATGAIANNNYAYIADYRRYYYVYWWSNYDGRNIIIKCFINRDIPRLYS